MTTQKGITSGNHDEETEHGTYLRFVPAPPKPKTKVWYVVNDSDEHLGWIAWFSRWRKYAFRPKADTWFEEVCLREVSDFCVKQTKIHKMK